jgi:hypothetical protein
MGVVEVELDRTMFEPIEDAVLAIDVAELELDWATLELIVDEMLTCVVETWGILIEDSETRPARSVLEEVWESDDPGIVVDVVKTLDTERPMLVNGVRLEDVAREIVLDDAGTVSPPRLMLGTFTDDVLRLLLPLDTTGMITTELLLKEVGKLTVDNVVLELGSTLDSGTLTEEEVADCEEITAMLTVEDDMTSAMMLLEVLTILEVTAAWEGALDVTESATEGFCAIADDNDVWLVPLTGMTPILILPTPMLTT